MTGTALANQLNLKATALYHSGDYRQAIQIWQEALQADPENQRAKEGIRMASLLLEEASVPLEAAPAETPADPPESPETIAKVREGIQRVRDLLSGGRYLDAMEVCQSLLQLAPRSEAVREVLEEAREAYEAQPFIDEHLEIARQLFIQERLDEASAELQKIFFLNASHAEARKLEAKIEALRQRLTPPQAAPDATPPAEFDASQTMRMTAPEGIEPAPPAEDEVALAPPAQEETPPTPPAQRAAPGQEILNEDWEAELAQLNLGPASEEPAAAPGEPEAEPIPLMDLSEDPGAAKADAATSPAAPGEELPDLSGDLARRPASAVATRDRTGAPSALRPALREKARPTRPAPRRERAPSSAGKVFFWMIALGALLGGGWWFLGNRSASSSGQGGDAGAPPIRRAPIRPQKNLSGQPGEPANVGLSGNSTRAGNAAAAGQQGAAIPAPVLTPEQAQKEIAHLFESGKAHMQRGDYAEAAADFSSILELDPANIEAKANLDQAASRVQDKKRLEEDLQTAKEYFLEKDYESALRKFYRLPKDQRLGEIDLFIRNAWYNWAVMSMKGGNCPEAIQRLDEALNSDANDEEASKLREVAEHYRDRPKDKVFYAYADRLTYRTLNQK
jgi:tetratricopeptide (TPR) repeat protein